MVHRHCDPHAAAEFCRAAQQLNTALMQTQYGLIGGHLPNLQLDVTTLMRSVMSGVILAVGIYLQADDHSMLV